MAISQSALRELRRELADLRQRRDVIDARIHGLEAILSLGGSSSRPLARDAEKAHIVRERPAVKPAARRGSLRAKIVETLSTNGARTADVAQRLSEEGFVVGGSATLRERVSRELSRLRRTGVVRRRRNGRYVLATNPKQTRSVTSDTDAMAATVAK